jgi:hypothetical protein
MSNTKTPEEMALAHLIYSAEQLTPKEHNRLGFSLIAQEAKKDGQSVLNQCRAVVAAIYDGIAYGNWPK